jgi:tetratricopeptide (TPR) repeat protein
MMRGIVMIWFAMCIAAPAQPSANQSTMEPIIWALRNQRFDEALSAAKSVLQEHPRDYRVWTLEGMALSGKGEGPSALAAFRRALTIAPDYKPALKAEARLLFQSGEKQAVDVLQKLIRLDPSDKTAHEMLAVSEARKKECKSAQREFAPLEEAIQSHPESLQWYGYCLTQEKEFAAAASAFTRLVELVPNELEPRFDLALVQTLANQNVNAIQTLQPLITGQSPNFDALSLAAEAYEAVGDTPRAVSLLRQAIDLDADNPDLYVRFAGLCLNHDSFQVGLDVVNAGLGRIPKSASMYVARGLLYGQMGDYSNAESDLQTAEQLNPAQTTSSFALAATAMQHGDLEKALETVREQLKTHPNDPRLRYMLAKILVDQGAKSGSPEFQEAMKSASMAVRAKPDFVPGHDLLATLYLNAGKNDLAAEQCRISLAVDPSDQSALYHLISALRSSGNRAEVQDLVKKLLALQRKTSEQPTARERYKIMERPSNSGDNTSVP